MSALEYSISSQDFTIQSQQSKSSSKTSKTSKMMKYVLLVLALIAVSSAQPLRALVLQQRKSSSRLRCKRKHRNSSFRTNRRNRLLRLTFLLNSA
ncbi:hypothetical protein Ocin01_13181 [Orchesella cincta]|uniref:Uncharacterized protein n=1 Tax=Orchesella cincta TaxID=48709 RepID=A0A1D2MKX4_ORCCI|nr:hypothetical protein Ocin01_13181 [Orchesella cincta]